MKVSEAVRQRKSVRAFLDRPVPAGLLREALELAARAPSGGNLQPWRLYLLAGEPLANLKAAMRQRLHKRPQPPAAEYDIYPKPLGEPYRTSRYEVGEAMYALLGIARENKLGRLLHLQQIYSKSPIWVVVGPSCMAADAERVSRPVFEQARVSRCNIAT